jgi:hypothetical protein
MNTIRQVIRRLLRGPAASRLLATFGIDAKRYWLLTDLFAQLSDQGEMLDQLGRNGVALKSAVWLYFLYSAIFTLALSVARPSLTAFFWIFQFLTGFLLFTILLSEAANSLINPAEGLVLAHQPINGATYTAAKLTHLLAIVFYLVPGLDLVPALAGLLWHAARWWYPFFHLAAALAVGLLASLFCCALYGWLIRFVPAKRLRAAGQLAATLQLVSVMAWQPLGKLFARSGVVFWLAADSSARWTLGLGSGLATIILVALGLRSLSADYLIRVSAIMRGGSSAGATLRRSRMGAIVARYFGGQPARAGFAFVSRMMLRDWQFRRQLVPLAVCSLIGLVPLAARGYRIDPLSRRFTNIHLLPHAFGALLFMVCNFLPYGADYKGAWIFLLAPVRSLGRFARGIHALLWLEMIVLPHLMLLGLSAWQWGLWHGFLFTTYSLAVTSFYLALDLRRIEGAPFSRQMNPAAGAALLPLMMLGGLAIAVAVGVQYWFVFRSATIVLATTVIVGATAYVLTRRSLDALEVSIRYHLGLLSQETGKLYEEINT